MTTLFKTLLGALVIALLSTTTYATNVFGTDPDGDTVIIKFGKNSKIVLYVDNKRDLEKISRYDINKMLEDLNMSVTEMDDTTKVLTIEDESGKKYLKDTTIVITKVEPQYDRDQDYDKDWNHDKDQNKSRSRYYHRSKFYFNIDMGLNSFLEDSKFPNGNELYALNPIGSWYWQFGPSYRNHILGPLFIDLGLNASCNVYRFDNPATRIEKTPAGIVFTEETRPVTNSKSKLSDWYIGAKAVPVLAFGGHGRDGWRLWNNIDRGIRIGFGGYVGYRVWSRTKYVYDDGGDKKKDKNTSNFLLNDVRYGVRGQFGFKGIDLFVEYDLNKMFQDGSGAPDLQRIQFGITL